MEAQRLEAAFLFTWDTKLSARAEGRGTTQRWGVCVGECVRSGDDNSHTQKGCSINCEKIAAARAPGRQVLHFSICHSGTWRNNRCVEHIKRKSEHRRRRLTSATPHSCPSASAAWRIPSPVCRMQRSLAADAVAFFFLNRRPLVNLPCWRSTANRQRFITRCKCCLWSAAWPRGLGCTRSVTIRCPWERLFFFWKTFLASFFFTIKNSWRRVEADWSRRHFKPLIRRIIPAFQPQFQMSGGLRVLMECVCSCRGRWKRSSRRPLCRRCTTGTKELRLFMSCIQTRRIYFPSSMRKKRKLSLV